MVRLRGTSGESDQRLPVLPVTGRRLAFFHRYFFAPSLLENNSKDWCLMIDTDNFYVVLEHETKGLFLHRLMHDWRYLTKVLEIKIELYPNYKSQNYCVPRNAKTYKLTLFLLTVEATRSGDKLHPSTIDKQLKAYYLFSLAEGNAIKIDDFILFFLYLKWWTPSSFWNHLKILNDKYKLWLYIIYPSSLPLRGP